jgi:hypothetical protein
MEQLDHQKIWNLIKDEHTAVLVTISPDGSLDSRPMGCIQKEFDSLSHPKNAESFEGNSGPCVHNV